MRFFAAIPIFVLVLIGMRTAPDQQAQASSAQRLAGVVISIDAPSSQVSFKTGSGETVTVTTTERTQILHALPGEADPKKWAKLTLAEIAAGDQAVAYFRGAADQKPLLATSLVIRTKTDLAQMAQRSAEDWKKRGTTGTVTAIDAAAKTIAIKVGQKSLTVQPSEKTDYHRYSLDSAKVSDAKSSTFAELKTGDQLNVLGNKTADGGAILAESIYAGTFRQIAATIVSIDPASGEIKVTDLAAKKPLTIRVDSDSTMKRLPEQTAQGLAKRYQGGGRGAGQGSGAQGGQQAGGDIGQMLERLPAMALSGLKPKDAIMVSTTMGSDPTRVTAIMLLAGVEPILTAAPNSTRDIMSGWNLGSGGGDGN